MRPLRFLVALLCIAAGVLIGALNPQAIALDLGFVVLHATLGVALLVALLCGVLVGGMILTVSVVLPLRQRLRRAQAPPPRTVAPPGADPGHGV
ncbi:lipopolysaccharide assembly protein LapA domain-containing protein [Luteimonas sp. RD2P54]|uniref:Lipopolysaccharide assembly protein LapA domain-containing protein n=1 Tax=Luteimonas endophytica TaxID=3042023 RepID=A0ABT6J3T2_9GAMM|nr:lipopolysaccharide assembly protein LapA domain-containing protein [Luteimonas endophytica]MDH5821471.1 lipopolysaccharide assembly protein LapA domain-containing protein [Luteimonas endophytica]